MLTPKQRSEFDERGFVSLRGVFSRAEAAAMQERLWATLKGAWPRGTRDSKTRPGRRAGTKACQVHWTVYVKCLRCASTFAPEAGAQCVSSARWDLGGGRPEPSRGRAVPTATINRLL